MGSMGSAHAVGEDSSTRLVSSDSLADIGRFDLGAQQLSISGRRFASEIICYPDQFKSDQPDWKSKPLITLVNAELFLVC
jgi:hypothetical protein